MKTNNGFVLREIYGKALLMPVKKNDVGEDPIFLNTVAAQIWKLVSEKNTADEIVSTMDQIYGLDEGSVEETSIKQFIVEMKNSGLLLEE